MCACSQAVESAEVPWEASPEDTTETLSTAVPDTEAAVDVGTELDAPGDGVTPTFLGATTTLLRTEEAAY